MKNDAAEAALSLPSSSPPPAIPKPSSTVHLELRSAPDGAKDETREEDDEENNEHVSVHVSGMIFLAYC